MSFFIKIFCIYILHQLQELVEGDKIDHTLIQSKSNKYSNLIRFNVDIDISLINSYNGIIQHNDIEKIQKNLQDSLSIYYPKLYESTTRIHLKYHIKEYQYSQEFNLDYLKLVNSQNLTIHGNINPIKVISSNTLGKFLNNIQDNYDAIPKMTWNLLPILIKLPVQNQFDFPMHTFSSKDHHCIQSYSSNVVFIDLTSYVSASCQKHFILSSKNPSKSWMKQTILSVIQSIETFLLSDNIIHSNILFSEKIFIPIVIMNYNDLYANHSSIESYTGSRTINPNIEFISDWMKSLITFPSNEDKGSIATTSIDISSTNYFIDEHPQVAMAINSALTSRLSKDSILREYYFDSNVLKHEIFFKSIGDQYFHQLFEKVGNDNEFDYLIHKDLYHLKVRKDRIDKLGNMQLMTPTTIPSTKVEDSSTIKKSQSLKDSKGDSKVKSHRKMVESNYRKSSLFHRRFSILPVFVISGFSINHMQPLFENNQPIEASCIDDNDDLHDKGILVLHSLDSQIETIHTNANNLTDINGLIASALTQAIIGHSHDSSIKDEEDDENVMMYFGNHPNWPFSSFDSVIKSNKILLNPFHEISILSWTAKRSILIQRCIQLMEAIRKVQLESKARIQFIDNSEVAIQRKLLEEWYDHIDSKIIELQEIFLSSKYHDILAKISVLSLDYDELIITMWEREKLYHDSIIEFNCITHTILDSKNISIKENRKEDSLKYSEKSFLFSLTQSITTKVLILIVIGGLVVYGSLLLRKNLNKNAKKLL